MTKLIKNKLVNQVQMGATEYEISTVLFRHAMGEVLGINVTDMECLGLIFFKGLASPTELAQYTGLTSGATTAMLDRLERAHLIERHPNPQDRRGTLIVQTNERKEEIGGMFIPLRQAIVKLTSSYSEAELESISDYFKKLVVIWEEERKRLQQRNKANLPDSRDP